MVDKRRSRPRTFGAGDVLLVLLFFVFANSRLLALADEDLYYKIVSVSTAAAKTSSRDANWKPGKDQIALEVSGIAVLDQKQVAVAIRKGEVWLIDGAYAEANDDGILTEEVTLSKFAEGLHEPLGLLAERGNRLLTVQRSELTELRDTDGDHVADQYNTIAKGWGVTGHYHEYAYGPKRDGDGNLWLTLNIGLGLKGDHLKRTIIDAPLGMKQGLWRGWGMQVDSAGNLIPVCGGMRSPSGLGPNDRGDMFYTDQQGNWVPAGSLHHMRTGVFFHHAEAIASTGHPDSPVRNVAQVPNGLPYPVALKQFPQLRPPAVWFPYEKMGQSATDIMTDTSEGKFGPFAGQMFVGEFTQAAINRVFLEKVDGQYQGACFPFRRGFASAVLRMAQGTDGRMFVGLTNRGWSSLGTQSYGLQRLDWTGRIPMEIKEMRATPDGFDLEFTLPVDPASVDSDAFKFESYTYLYHSTYGSAEIDRRSLLVNKCELSADHRTVSLAVDQRRPLYVHELHVDGVRGESGDEVLHPHAYYTLNRIPKRQ